MVASANNAVHARTCIVCSACVERNQRVGINLNMYIAPVMAVRINLLLSGPHGFVKFVVENKIWLVF